jgi:hypothetical protein
MGIEHDPARIRKSLRKQKRKQKGKATNSQISKQKKMPSKILMAGYSYRRATIVSTRIARRAGM